MKRRAWAAMGLAAVVGLAWGAQRLIHPPLDRAVARIQPERIRRATAKPGEATVLFAGDTAEVDAALPWLMVHSLEWPFELTIDTVRDADLAIANEEAPITDGGKVFGRWKQYVYRAPAASAGVLAWAGFDVLELANNHTLDYSASGLQDTLRNVRRAGMVPVGAGMTEVEARRGLIVDLGGVRMGLLDYCEDKLLWRTWVRQYAAGSHPGVAALSEGALAADVKRLRPEVDVLVVSLHIGENYAPPTRAAIRWSERAIDLGADLVVNHHPHVAHPVMMYRGRPILLSLGNYAFGTPGRATLDDGLLALLHMTRRGITRVELIPIDVQNRRVHFRPAPLYGEALTRALERLKRESARYGAALRIDSGRAIIDVAARAR